MNKALNKVIDKIERAVERVGAFVYDRVAGASLLATGLITIVLVITFAILAVL